MWQSGDKPRPLLTPQLLDFGRRCHKNIENIVFFNDPFFFYTLFSRSYSLFQKFSKNENLTFQPSNYLIFKVLAYSFFRTPSFQVFEILGPKMYSVFYSRCSTPYTLKIIKKNASYNIFPKFSKNENPTFQPSNYLIFKVLAYSFFRTPSFQVFEILGPKMDSVFIRGVVHPTP